MLDWLLLLHSVLVEADMHCCTELAPEQGGVSGF